MKFSKHHKHISVYEGNSRLNDGIGVWGEMFHELLHYRGLLWSLMIRDIRARYKQSIIGLLWPFLSPLVLVVIFVWIRSRNILPIGETDMPYPAFVFVGQIVWLLFSRGVTTCSTSLVGAENLLTKVPAVKLSAEFYFAGFYSSTLNHLQNHDYFRGVAFFSSLYSALIRSDAVIDRQWDMLMKFHG